MALERRWKTFVRQANKFMEQEARAGTRWLGKDRPYPLFMAYAGICNVVFLLSFLVLPFLSKTYRRSKRQVKLDWNNRATAMLHAIVMTYFVYKYWLFINPLWKTDITDLKVPKRLDGYEADVMRLMTGYMIYDTVIELVTPAHYNYEVLFHHLVGLVSHIYTLAVSDGPSGWFTMLVYLAEASTPLLHLGWMMHMSNMDNSPLFMAITALLLVIFFACRVLLSPVLVIAYLSPKNRKLYEGRDAVFYFQLFVVFAFCCLNLYWFYKLSSLALRKVRGGSKTSPKEALQKEE